MSDENVEKTSPVKISRDPEQTMPVRPLADGTDAPTIPVQTLPNLPVEPPSEPVQPGKVRRWPWIVGGIVLILLLGALGTFMGYRSASQTQKAKNQEQLTQITTEQFMLALQEQSKGNYDIALKRLEYVIQLDPNFPGVRDKLAEVMLAKAVATTPTVGPALPTITPSPTPDFRGEEDIFKNAQQLMANKDFFNAVQVLDTLRDKNVTYKALEVDGMYYIALRFRGIYKINGGNLESGLYDLALAERFAPLDIDALGARNWARLYITGASFWKVQWDKVIFYFTQLVPYYPNMKDSYGMTATERLRKAYIGYGDELVGKGKFCEAEKQYLEAQKIVVDNALDATIKSAHESCNPAKPTSEASPTPTATSLTPLATGTTPTTVEPSTSTPTNTPETTAIPTVTPTPAPTT